MSVGERFSQRSNSRQKGGVMDMTTWGTLTLEENPKMPMGVTGWEDAISPKVPRMITLRGNSNYIGRVRKASGGQAQTMIELSYISSSHCCLFLRPKSQRVGIEAAVVDTSSNGTSVNGSKLGKKVTRALKQGDEIALYLPQSASPLGRTILYKLEMDETKMAQALLEDPPVSLPTKRSRATASASAAAKTLVGPQSQNSQQSPAPAATGAANGRVAAATVGAGGTPESSIATPSKEVARSGTKSGARANGVKMEVTQATTAAGAERNVLDLLDDKVAVKKAAEESARKGWESERQRFVQQTRTLRAQLDVAAEKNQKLLSEKNALQEKFAEAECSKRDDVERVARERESKLKAEMSDAVAKMKEALQAAKRERVKAEACAKAEVDAIAAAKRRNTEWKNQVDALNNQKAQQIQRLAEVAASGKEMERSLVEVRNELAEASMKNSSLTAQLKEARASEQSLRSRVSEEERASTAARQARAEVEGRLTQTEKELAASETARKELEPAAENAERLAREIEEMEAAGFRGSKDLEQAVSELEEERRLRAEEAVSRAKMADEVAELTSMVADLKASLEDCLTKRDSARTEVARLTEELKESKKQTRTTEAKLAETQSDLTRCTNRKEGVKGEAYIMGRNLEKAKKAANDLSTSFSEQLAVLLRHLEVPGGYLQLDSQVAQSPAGLLEDDDVSEADQKTDSMGGSPMPSNGVGELVTTQVSPGNTAKTSLFPPPHLAHSGDGDALLPRSDEGEPGPASTSAVPSMVDSHLPSEDDVMAAIRAEGVKGSGAALGVNGWKGKGKARDGGRAVAMGDEGDEDGDYEGAVGDGRQGNVEDNDGDHDDYEDGDDNDADATDGEEEDGGGGGGGEGGGGGGGRGAVGVEGHEESKESSRNTVDNGSIDNSGDAALATTGMRLEEDRGGGEKGEGRHDEEYEEDDTEFTVPPLDFGRGTRPVEPGEYSDSEEGGDEEDFGRRDLGLDSTQVLTTDDIRLGVAGARQPFVAADISRKRGRSEEGWSQNSFDKKAKIHAASNGEGADEGEDLAGASEIADVIGDVEGDPPEGVEGSTNPSGPSDLATTSEAGVGQDRGRSEGAASERSWIGGGVDAGDGGERDGYGEEVAEEELEDGGRRGSVSGKLGELRTHDGEGDGMETTGVHPQTGGVGYNNEEDLDTLA